MRENIVQVIKHLFKFHNKLLILEFRFRVLSLFYSLLLIVYSKHILKFDLSNRLNLFIIVIFLIAIFLIGLTKSYVTFLINWASHSSIRFSNDDWYNKAQLLSISDEKCLNKLSKVGIQNHLNNLKSKRNLWNRMILINPASEFIKHVGNLQLDLLNKTISKLEFKISCLNPPDPFLESDNEELIEVVFDFYKEHPFIVHYPNKKLFSNEELIEILIYKRPFDIYVKDRYGFMLFIHSLAQHPSFNVNVYKPFVKYHRIFTKNKKEEFVGESYLLDAKGAFKNYDNYKYFNDFLSNLKLDMKLRDIF